MLKNSELIYEVSVQPKVEPISINEAKQHLRVTCDTDDEYISALITAVRIYAEQYTGRAFISQTQIMYLDDFPLLIRVPNPPMISVSSIVYVDTAGDDQTLSTSIYTVDTKAEPGRIYEAYNESWPSTRNQRKAVTITYIAGYGTDPNSVPQTIRQGMLILLANWYENRVNVTIGNPTEIPMSAKALLDIDRSSL